jgi:hypothetical protein
MTIKGTPNVTDRKFVVNTPHRNVQLFKLRPLDVAGTMVGKEDIYTCKADPITSKVTDPDKPIPVTPHT